MSRSLLICIVSIVVITDAGQPLAQQGHEIDDLRNRITVNGREQWAQWSFPHGTIEFAPARPHPQHEFDYAAA